MRLHITLHTFYRDAMNPEKVESGPGLKCPACNIEGGIRSEVLALQEVLTVKIM